MKFNVKATMLLLSILMLFMVTSVVIAEDVDQGVKLSATMISPQYQTDRDIVGRGWGITAEKQINVSDTAPLSLNLGYISYRGNDTVKATQIPLLLKTTISEGDTYISVGAGAIYTNSAVLGTKLGGNIDTVFCYQVTGGVKVRNLVVEVGYIGNSVLPGYTVAIGGKF